MNFASKQLIDFSCILDIELSVKTVKLRHNNVVPHVVKLMDLIFFFLQRRSGLVLQIGRAHV